MTQPARTLKQCYDNKATSLFPTGNKPAGALVYYNLTNPGVTPVHGDLVAICTNGTYDFGAVGPKLVNRLILKNATVGDVSDITTIYKTSSYMQSMVQGNANAGSSDGKFKVQADAALPYGLGVAVGQPLDSDHTKAAANLVVTSKTEDTETFTHVIYHYPTANQTQFYSYVQTSTDPNWGIKYNWHTYQTGSSGQGINIDYFFGAIRVTGSQPNVSAAKEELSQSNDPGGTNHLITGNTQCVLNPSDATKWRSAPIIQQHYINVATSGKIEAKLIDTSAGVVYGFSDNSISQNTAVASNINTFDTYYISAQSNGFYIDVGANYLVAEQVTWCGPGATCRVTITDVAGPGAVGSGQKMETINDFGGYWSSDTTVCKIIEGMFAGQSLAGKYFNLWKAGNSYVASTGAIQ